MIRIPIDEHTLVAVPAVHYCATFAELVYQACSTGLDAVAVELGPSAVDAVVAWMGELGIGPGKETKLPCMLGLVRTNHRIDPRRKNAAIRLQEITGKHLHELEPSLLREHLNFSTMSLLCLSPTDSIIEAIRCALELGIPVYGIDLEDFASVERVSPMIQDPIMARQNPKEYVQRNAPLSERGRDDYIDRRREEAMAARLKALLRNHERLLFTGGLAHWNSIQELLENPQFGPADDDQRKQIIEGMQNGRAAAAYHRVLVHPILATRQMDVFPIVTRRYQRRREPVEVNEDGIEDPIDFHKLFQDLLHRTYKKFFAPSDDESQLDRKLEDQRNRKHFERLLWNYCAVGQQMVPSLSDALNVAECTMSRSFCTVLAEEFMRYNWACPSEYPTLPIVGPVPQLEGEAMRGEGAQKVEIAIPNNHDDGDSGNTAYQKSRPFYISCLPEGGSRKIPAKAPWQWNDAPKVPMQNPAHGNSRIWPPDDSLLFGTALQAKQIASQTWHERQSEPFEGSLMDGVDIKATLRSKIRGEDRIYVRWDFITSGGRESTHSTLDPTVFIFRRPQTDEDGHWKFYGGSMEGNHKQHIKDKERLKEVQAKYGDYYMQGFAFVKSEPVPPNLEHFVVAINTLRGIVVFGNPCLDAKQEAKWLVDTKYERAPILGSGDVHELISAFQKRHRMQLDPDDWPTTLIRLAIPYARRQVVVIAPDHLALPPSIFQEARAHRIHIAVVPMSYFPAQTIKKIAHQREVYPKDQDGRKYSSDLETLLGESVKTYSELIPAHLGPQAEVDRS